MCPSSDRRQRSKNLLEKHKTSNFRLYDLVASRLRDSPKPVVMSQITVVLTTVSLFMLINENKHLCWDLRSGSGFDQVSSSSSTLMTDGGSLSNSPAAD